jgi:hypothetical protein
MLGSNPSADSAASTDRGGMLRHPFFVNCGQSPLIGTGTKALNPGGAGAKPPLSDDRSTLFPAQGERSVFRFFCSERERRQPHKQLPPSVGRTFIMH